MPCYEPPGPYDDPVILRQKIDDRTRLLCYASRLLFTAYDGDPALSKELHEWWIEHEKWDKQRGPDK